MTHPNVLRLARSCAKWRSGWLLVAVLLPSLMLGADHGSPRVSADSLPLPPGPVVVGKKGIVAAGDTLVYTISWGPGARATSYNTSMTVTSTNGVWTVVADSNGSGRWVTGNGIGLLPASGNVTFTNLKTWITAVPWDSATFTVSVSSKNAVGVSTPVSTSWKVSRKPGPPGPITIDSSLIVVGVLVQPKPVDIFLGQSRIMCAFSTFGNGAVAQHTVDKPSCDSIYVRTVPATARALVTVAQQAHTDSTSKTCVTWATDAPMTAVTIAPLASCSAAVRVTGVGLTRRFPADAVRDVLREIRPESRRVEAQP